MKKRQINALTLALLLANIMAGLDGTIINTALPAIIADLKGIEYMGWSVALFLFGMSVSTPLWSKFGEKMGNKFAFNASLLLFVISSALGGLAKSMPFFVFARGLMGIGAGGMGALPYIMLGYVFTNIKQRTKILGYLAGGFSAAAIAGPIIGGWIVDTFSWKWVFYINIPIGLASMLLIGLFYQEQRQLDKSPFDLLGSILLVVGLSMILFALQMLGLMNNWVLLVVFILGIIIMTAFVRYEIKQKYPLINMELFKNKTLVGDYILFSLAWGAFIGINIYLPMWAQGLLGVSALIGGMALIPNSITDLIGAQVVSFFQARWKNYQLLVLGITCIGISIFGLMLTSVNISYPMLMFLGTFSGFGVGFIFVLLQVKVQIDVDQNDMAVATSLSYLIRILAQTFMSAIYGVVMNLSLMHIIKQSGGKVTLEMMNKLSDTQAVGSLPQKLLPQMRSYLHFGLHNIMLTALILIVLAYITNYYFNKKSK